MKAKDGTLYAVLGLLVTLGVTHMARQADTDANIDGINSIIDQAQELSEISHEKLDSGDYSRTEVELEIDELGTLKAAKPSLKVCHEPRTMHMAPRVAHSTARRRQAGA